MFYININLVLLLTLLTSHQYQCVKLLLMQNEGLIDIYWLQIYY